MAQQEPHSDLLRSLTRERDIGGGQHGVVSNPLAVSRARREAQDAHAYI